MQEWAQWWFVITSPSRDTKLAEQPCASRADESRRWSSHLSSTATPYFCWSLSLGKLLYVHIPSSAAVVRGASVRARSTAETTRVMLRPPDSETTTGVMLAVMAPTSFHGFVRVGAAAP